MKLHFNRLIPEEPESFRSTVEQALARTAAQPVRRTARIRPKVLLAAALAAALLTGSALALGSRLGLWDFLKLYGSRAVPSSEPPETEPVNASAVSDAFVLTVPEAYREGRTVTILVQLAGTDDPLTSPQPWEAACVRTEDGAYLEVQDEQRMVDGVSYHALTCVLPEDAPDTTTLYVSMAWYADGEIPVTVSRRDGARFASVVADHLTLSGSGITFTDLRLTTTALNRTLTLRYAYDPSAVAPPDLPSQNLTYYAADGTYHTRPDCPALPGEAKEIALKDIVEGGLVPCSEEDCSFFTEPYQPLEDGVCLELLDADGNPLPCEGPGLISPEKAVPGENGAYETTFLLDGLPDVLQLRAYDCWTKRRWRDTVTLSIGE